MRFFKAVGECQYGGCDHPGIEVTIRTRECGHVEPPELIRCFCCTARFGNVSLAPSPCSDCGKVTHIVLRRA